MPKRINVDRTEIVCVVVGKRAATSHILSYTDITRIQFDRLKETVYLVFKKSSEKITIYSGKLGKPAVYTKMKNKKFFMEYKEDLERFAKRNSITFTNNIK